MNDIALINKPYTDLIKAAGFPVKVEDTGSAGFAFFAPLTEAGFAGAQAQFGWADYADPSTITDWNDGESLGIVTFAHPDTDGTNLWVGEFDDCEICTKLLATEWATVGSMPTITTMEQAAEWAVNALRKMAVAIAPHIGNHSKD